MALESTGVTLFPGDPSFDMFIASMAEMPNVGDEISKYVPVWNYLERKKLIKKRDSIGVYVPVVVMDKNNPTIQWVSGYDDAISQPSEALSEGRAQYGHLTGRMLTNREEQTKNSGKEQLIDLIETKRKQLRIGLVNSLHTGLLSADEADGRKITGLGRIMDETVAVHNLSPIALPFWKPTVVYKTGTTKFALATEYRDGMRKLFRRTKAAANNTSSDLVLCGEDVFDAAAAWAESKLQMGVKEAAKAPVSIGGDTEFEYAGRTYMYVEEMAAKDVWALNFNDGIEVRAHRGTWFYQTPWEKLPGKVQTIYSDNLTYLSLYCTNRKANGKIQFS